MVASPHARAFILGSGVSFFCFNWLFFYLYGFEFIENGLLYHIIRTDHRHNFGLYFYSIYLTYDRPSRLLRGLALFLPQVAVLCWSSLTLGGDLPVALSVQTVSFVAFNKVCTAQYFTW